LFKFFIPDNSVFDTAIGVVITFLDIAVILVKKYTAEDAIIVPFFS
jgi:hypothetical protein